ncbi:PEP-CTERM sorting domain-containing protein [Lacipirellula parvula]|uniref:Ice-binding protein C-terminal domain-containing protein n=1 Tax=Lacipirellula parvula TaxID=2650471 RepID=A0A5K7XAF8_9BACT|nr:PEP-CTERM sorting domain-containing protein [Lacipirellula parvula]BBO32917.1 hypothetical protein PLANPX_2529 [Lacipirellula parvula]
MLHSTINRRLGTALLLAVITSTDFGASSLRADQIDTFDDATSFNLSPTSTTPSGLNIPVTLNQTAADGIDPAVTLGGERFISISGGGFLDLPTVRKQSGEHSISFSSASRLGFKEASVFLLDYGRTTPLTDGLGGIDFDAQWDNVTVGVTFARSNNFPAVSTGYLTVAFESGDHAGGTIRTGSITKTFTAAGDFAFAFNELGYAGVDFSDVTQVTVSMREGSLDGARFTISGISREAVPEPASIGLASVAIVSFAALRRRQ